MQSRPGEPSAPLPRPRGCSGSWGLRSPPVCPTLSGPNHVRGFPNTSSCMTQPPSHSKKATSSFRGNAKATLSGCKLARTRSPVFALPWRSSWLGPSRGQIPCQNAAFQQTNAKIPCARPSEAQISLIMSAGSSTTLRESRAEPAGHIVG